MLGKLGLRQRLILLCVLCTVAGTVVAAVVSYYDMARQTRTNAVAELAWRAESNARNLRYHFENVISDATFLEGTPPVGSLRLIETGKIDTVDADDRDTWRGRLERIFAALIEARPYYTQVRFIGIADNGREVVRVDQKDGRVRAVPDGQLQAKGNEPYMRPVVTGEATETFFSDLTFNREFGTQDPDGTYVIRLVHPISDPRGGNIGALVINVDYEAMLEVATSDLTEGHRLTIANAKGDTLSFGDGVLQHGLNNQKVQDFWPGIDAEFLAANARRVVRHETAARTYYAAVVEVSSVDNLSALQVITSVSTARLMAAPNAILRRQVVVSMILILIAGLAAWHMAGHVTAPLRRLMSAITDQRNDEILDMDIDSQDEIGAFARLLIQNRNDIITHARNVFDQASDGFLMVDPDGIIQSVNPAAQAIFGWEAQDLVGEPLEKLIPEDRRAAHAGYMRLADRTGQAKKMAPSRDVQGLRADGTTFPIEVTINHVNTQGKSVFLAVLRDITERRGAEEMQKQLIANLKTSNDQFERANRELVAAKRDLERSNEELDKLAYVASHDLKAPLRIIDNASQWLEEDLADVLDDDTRESMQMLRNRVQRMEKLLDDLLAHSRIGRIEERSDEITGSELMANVLALAVPPQGIEVETRGFETLIIRRLPIQTVLLNLVSNSIKHHHRSEGQISVSVEDQGEFWRFSVTDDGPGIPAKFHETVFGMFQTLRPRDQVEGSGMGLAMVKKTVEISGGEVTLQSQEGQGSTFSFTWPKPSQADIDDRKERAA